MRADRFRDEALERVHETVSHDIEDVRGTQVGAR